jgi:hypothetical protein
MKRVQTDEPKRKLTKKQTGELGSQFGEEQKVHADTEEAKLREERAKIGTVPTPAQPKQTPRIRAPEKREDERLAHLETSDFSSQEPPARGGVNTTFIVTLSTGEKAMWKPADGEIGVAPGTERYILKRGVKPGTMYLREAAFWRLADILGFGDLVPETTIRQQGEIVGSIQKFVGDAQTASDLIKEESGEREERGEAAMTHLGAWNRRGVVMAEKAYDGHKDAARAAILDYIAGHLDRHAGNWLVKDGELKLIDNGLAFPSKHDRRDFRASHNLILHHALDWDIPDTKELEGKWGEIEKEFQRLGLDEEAIKMTGARLSAVIQGNALKIGDLPILDEPHGKLRDLIGERKRKAGNEDIGPTKRLMRPKQKEGEPQPLRQATPKQKAAEGTQVAVNPEEPRSLVSVAREPEAKLSGDMGSPPPTRKLRKKGAA